MRRPEQHDAGSRKIQPGDVVGLVRQHQAGVWRYLRALGCEAALAEDLTQETFLAVLEKPFLHHSDAATGAYLRKVARNLYISMQRRSGKMRLVEDLEAFEGVWRQWAGEDHGESLLQSLQQCLKQLTQRARWALEMRFKENRSREGIAAALEITEDGAKNLMQRAKRQLRDCVESKISADSS